MLNLVVENSFKKDIKRAQKRRKDLEKIWAVAETLQQGKTLAAKYRPHKLSGNWSPFWECHIEPDWLLIYLITDESLILVRTGTHTDLFD